jgi:DNA processing protein
LTEEIILEDLAPHIALTHVASQLLGRWLSFPDICQISRHCDGLFHLTIEDWECFLHEDRLRAKPRLYWLEFFTKRQPSLLYDLPYTCYTHFQELKKNDGTYLLFCDPFYPRELIAIDKPPLMLSVLGQVDCLNNRRISVVGSRQVNTKAVAESFKTGLLLADHSLCIVSGGAIGCDILVHQGMLAGGRDSILACVVFAGGLSCLYPRRHASIFSQLLQRGGVFLSEKLWWSPSKPYDFPIRNRIVSGLSNTLVVMQASESSGAMITANEALDQGRDVWVLEHDPNDVRAFGSNQLIREGAESFSGAQGLLDLIKNTAVLQNNKPWDLSFGQLP